MHTTLSEAVEYTPAWERAIPRRPRKRRSMPIILVTSDGVGDPSPSSVTDRTHALGARGARGVKTLSVAIVGDVVVIVRRASHSRCRGVSPPIVVHVKISDL
ncbi:MAG: hypothetical protein NVSMB2_08310 [Chloroflexota bacterium]